MTLVGIWIWVTGSQKESHHLWQHQEGMQDAPVQLVRSKVNI